MTIIITTLLLLRTLSYISDNIVGLIMFDLESHNI